LTTSRSFRWVAAIAALSPVIVPTLQPIHAEPQASNSMHLPILVDGAITPNQIPDALAYRHFFTAIAAHPFPSQEEAARQSAQLSKLGLSPEDRQVLIVGLASFRTQLDQIESARANVAPGATAPAQLSALENQTNALVSTTVQGVRKALTAPGQSSLDNYLKTRVKSHIRIYGGAH
jgi:hypothetical protein